MKPIFILAIAAIAATGIGAAQLGNDIAVTAGGFGVGGANIETPIDDAQVTFTVDQVTVGEGTDGHIKNLITECIFHSEDSIKVNATIICKLSDDMQGDVPGSQANIVAEGQLYLENESYEGSTFVNIPITNTAYPAANSVFDIKDVHIVVIGENATEPDT